MKKLDYGEIPLLQDVNTDLGDRPRLLTISIENKKFLSLATNTMQGREEPPKVQIADFSLHASVFLLWFLIPKAYATY